VCQEKNFTRYREELVGGTHPKKERRACGRDPPKKKREELVGGTHPRKKRRACGRDPPIEEIRACGRDPPEKKKKIKHYMLCLSYPQAQEGQINSLQLSNNIL
jgi:hypothetical protein